LPADEIAVRFVTTTDLKSSRQRHRRAARRAARRARGRRLGHVHARRTGRPRCQRRNWPPATAGNVGRVRRGCPPPTYQA